MPRRGPRSLIHLLLLGLILLGAACSHAPLNAPLGKPGEDGSAQLLSAKIEGRGTGRLLVGLYFSGGGSRAAALAYGVLKELSQTPLPGGGRMLDSVIAINAVSGGSFPSAYYCLYGDRVFTEFEPLFLDQDIQAELMHRCFGPRGMIRISSSTFARSDVAAEFYDEKLFHGATFGDLARGGRRSPFLVLHATDLADCTPFQFTQDQFDLIGSDLSQYPISRAIAASSAFPVLLSPVVLRNYGPREEASRSLWRQPVASQSLFGLRQDAIRRHAEQYQDTKRHPYLHLVDGGLSDNLGLLSFIDVVAMKGGWGAMMDSVRKAGCDRIALIVVDASIENEQPWELSPETPTTKMAVRAMSNALVRRNNRIALESVQTCLRVCIQERRALRHPDEPEDPRVYFISLGFADLPDAAERERINRIETRLSIRRDDAQAVIRAAATLLRKSPDFQRLQHELQAEKEVH